MCAPDHTARRDEQYAPWRAATRSGVSSSSSRVRVLISAPLASRIFVHSSRPCRAATCDRGACHPRRGRRRRGRAPSATAGRANARPRRPGRCPPRRAPQSRRCCSPPPPRAAAPRAAWRPPRAPGRRRPRRRRPCQQLRVSHVRLRDHQPTAAARTQLQAWPRLFSGHREPL